MERGALASRNTILLGLVAMSSACASFHTEVVAPELTPGVQREEQLSSLRYLYYRNGQVLIFLSNLRTVPRARLSC